MTTVADEIMVAVNKMTEAEQRKLLANIKREDISPYGIPADEFMAFVRTLNFDQSFLDAVEYIFTHREVDIDDIEPLDSASK